MNASCGMSTLPTRFIRFLPSFCFSSSFRLRPRGATPRCNDDHCLPPPASPSMSPATLNALVQGRPGGGVAGDGTRTAPARRASNSSGVM